MIRIQNPDLDTDRDPNHHQNVIDYSLGRAHSSKNFIKNPLKSQEQYETWIRIVDN